ncbi:MAG TPA: class I SAM-dependent methyltransferase [Microlunatus sp.]|nr:class I SAM-dependent methyltransferase [Microlunatus sp.]
MTYIEPDTEAFLLALRRALQRPEPFEPSDAPFWDDPYIARQLLSVHLDQDDEAASRPAVQLDRCVANLMLHGLTGPGRAVLDLGCGPGLVAERLAASGASVTGIDLSESSLAHARESAARQGLDIRYRMGDFRTLRDDQTYDLVLQSYGEFGTLDPQALDVVLRASWRALRPGGALVFDVTAPAAHTAPTSRRWDWLSGGLWRPAEHLVLSDRLDFAEDIHCDRYVVLDGRTVTTYRMWKRAFTADRLADVLMPAGFAVEELWSGLDGAPYEPTSSWIAVLARRPQTQ